MHKISILLCGSAQYFVITCKFDRWHSVYKIKSNALKLFINIIQYILTQLYPSSRNVCLSGVWGMQLMEVMHN